MIGAELRAKISNVKKAKSSKELRYNTDVLKEEETLNAYKIYIEANINITDDEPVKAMGKAYQRKQQRKTRETEEYLKNLRREEKRMHKRKKRENDEQKKQNDSKISQSRKFYQKVNNVRIGVQTKSKYL